MGIVAKQGIWNTITLFLGVLLGGINTMILFPMILFPEEYGLTRIMVTIAMLAGQFAMFGMPSILIKFLHSFRKEEGRSHGFLRFVLITCFVGVLVVCAIIFFGRSWIIKPYQDNAEMLIDKYYLLYPFVFFIMLNGVLSQYLKAVFHSVFQLVISEIFMRIAQTVLLLLYYFEYFGFDVFMLFFVLIYGIESLLLLGYLIKIGEFDLKSDNLTFTKKNRQNFFKYGIANFFSGIGFKLSNMIDVLMIGAMIGVGEDVGLKAIAIYSLAVYMSSVIEMPARAIGNIAFSLVGKAWSNNDLEGIHTLYSKSAINQLIIGGIVFIGIWVNIDNIIIVLNLISQKGFDFSEIKYVMLFLGVAKLFHVASGINGGIIITSKYYLFGTYTTVGLIFITFFTNWIFIPIYGIVGAALATAISLFLFNFISFTFLLVKFKMQPFSLKTLLTIFIGIGTYFIVSLIPQISSPLVDVIIRSLIVMAIYMPLIIAFRTSEDFTALFNKVSMKFGIKSMK